MRCNDAKFTISIYGKYYCYVMITTNIVGKHCNDAMLNNSCMVKIASLREGLSKTNRHEKRLAPLGASLFHGDCKCYTAIPVRITSS